MFIRTEVGEFLLKVEEGHEEFTPKLYNDLEARLLDAAKTLGIDGIANVALAVKAVKKNTGNLEDYLINVVDSVWV